MPRNPRPIDDDRIRAGDPLATSDAIKAIYDAVLDLQRVVAATSIAWRTVEFDAADFSTDGGTWTVQAADVNDYKYARLGADLVVVQFQINSTSLGAGTHSQLQIRLPRGLLIHATAHHQGYLAYSDNGGTWALGNILAEGATATMLLLFKMPFVTNWTASVTNATSVRGFIVFQIAPVAGN